MKEAWTGNGGAKDVRSERFRAAGARNGSEAGSLARGDSRCNTKQFTTGVPGHVKRCGIRIPLKCFSEDFNRNTASRSGADDGTAKAWSARRTTYATDLSAEENQVTGRAHGALGGDEYGISTTNQC